MSGPPPEPTKLRVLRGNPSKTAINQHEPQPSAIKGKVEPPAWLSAAARRNWRRLAPRLQRMQVLTEADLDSLAAMCSELAIYVAMQRVLEAEGRTYSMVTKQGGAMVMRRPEVEMANQALANFTRQADRFGLNPAYRSKLKVEAEGELDPLEELLSGHGD